MLCLLMAIQLAFPIDTASGPRMPIYYTPCEQGPVHVMSRDERAAQKRDMNRRKLKGQG